MAEATSPISQNPKQLFGGLNLDSVASQVKQGEWSWSVNAIIENFDGNQVMLQNEQANLLCTNFPDGFIVNGWHNIVEDGIKLFFLLNPATGESEIGKIVECVYSKIINADCLAFDLNHPILKTAHRKIECGDTEVYWVNNWNRNRYLNLNELPFKQIPGIDGCHPIITDEVDCNLMNIQPDFSIPQIEAIDVRSDGTLIAGTYQFAVQYADEENNGMTSYYSVTNPLPIFDPTKITLDFNYEVGKAIVLNITDIDITGLYTAINIAVIKTINNITSVELVGTYSITGPTLSITYTGQGKTDIKLSTNDIFQKYDIYETADILTVAQDTLILADLTTQERLSYQEIASQIDLLWQTWRVPINPGYSKELNAEYLRGYMRDEVYPWEIVFLLDNGYQTDGFHMPGRLPTETDTEFISNNDVIPDSEGECDPPSEARPRWQVYNTGCLYGFDQKYIDFTQGIVYPCPKCPPVIETIPENVACYTGPYQYGCMAYWESTDVYPCNDIYGSLQNTPIRHPKFPDSLITHIHDDDGFIYPIGLRIDIQQIATLIKQSTSLTEDQKNRIQGFKIVRGNRANSKSIIAKGLINNVGKYTRDEQTYFYPNYPYNDLRADPFLSSSRTGDDSGRNVSTRLQGFNSDDSKNRWTFHSPDTSFYQPTLGSILKLETAEYGDSKGHFQLVQKHSRYKFLSAGSYAAGLVVALLIGIISNAPVTGNTFNGTAAFTAYNTFLDIVENLVPRQNFAYQYNSIGEYNEFKTITNNGTKQRRINLSFYLEPGMVNRGDTYTINNFQREGAVYLRTSLPLPFTTTIPGVPADTSRWIVSDYSCDTPNNIQINKISSFYSSIKRNIPNQYGQLYSYETIDTGYQYKINIDTPYPATESTLYIFGGDVFINKFAYKSKLPFFIDNRVGDIDESGVEYDELPNVAYPIFWLSTDSDSDVTGGSGGVVDTFKQFFGVKLNNFDCKSPKFFYQKGKFYLFAYGIPYFYVESDVNVSLRQAFNDKEGDFFPRVSSDIPDQWLQEINTTINQDNTYYYNKTYSKQNKENFFAHLPNDWDSSEDCTTNFPFRGIFSEDWHLFKPSSRVDFPQNFGHLTSLDGIENKQVLARFENKTLLYNALLTAPTSAADVYLGQSLFSQTVPPLDYGDTDLGYIGSQHKFLLKTEYGHVTVDSRRGQIFLLLGQDKKEITNENVSKFFTEFLEFQINKSFPDVNIDNTFNGIGITGVYDTKYDRLIVTKLDYKPLVEGITHSNGAFYYDSQPISLNNRDYFCSYSFTASYSFKYGVWVSLHTYIPNYYIGGDNVFYSGINNGPSSIWTHNLSIDKFNNFYDSIHPYVIEYPYSFAPQDQILQNIKDYSRIFQYTELREFVETDDYYFNKLVGYSNQQCTGILKLIKKPPHNLSTYSTYPVYNTDNKEVVFTKSGSFYQVNTFWDMVKSVKKPIWLKSCESLSVYKELNQENLDYGKRSYLKSPLRSKELKLRFTLDDRDDLKVISSFTLAPSQTSFK